MAETDTEEITQLRQQLQEAQQTIEAMAKTLGLERTSQETLQQQLQALQQRFEPCRMCQGTAVLEHGHLGDVECSSCEGSGVEPDPRLSALEQERDTLQEQVKDLRARLMDLAQWWSQQTGPIQVGMTVRMKMKDLQDWVKAQEPESA